MEMDSRIANDRVHEAIKGTKDSHTAMSLETAMNSRVDRLLGSLKYPMMSDRRNQIKDPCRETFQWIFKYSMGDVQGSSNGNSDAEGESDPCGDELPEVEMSEDGASEDETFENKSVGYDEADEVEMAEDKIFENGSYQDRASDNESLGNSTDTENQEDRDVNTDSERPAQDDGEWDSHMFNEWECRAHKLRVRMASQKFCRWLRTPDADLFWICGKPGSGKSTFVKFLSEDPRTLEMLNTPEEEAAPDFEVLSHFICISGQPMEAKIKGILCSLVYQLVQKDRDRSYIVSQAILKRFPGFESKYCHSD